MIHLHLISAAVPEPSRRTQHSAGLGGLWAMDAVQLSSSPTRRLVRLPTRGASQGRIREGSRACRAATLQNGALGRWPFTGQLLARLARLVAK